MIVESLPPFHEAAPVIVSLIIIEGLLSVDNILAIASMAAQLPEKQKKRALRLGMAGAYVFRGLALFFVGFIMANAWVKFLGAFYLIHLMADHFSVLAAQDGRNPQSQASKRRTFWSTVLAIQLMDLSLSVDNVVTAVAMSSDIRVVCLGVCLGLMTLWMFATFSLKLDEKFPVLQHTAFLLIGFVGVVLLAELTSEFAFHRVLHIGAGQKFLGVLVIMALSMGYSRSAAMRRAGGPLVRAALRPMVLYARGSSFLLGALLRPLRYFGSGRGH